MVSSLTEEIQVFFVNTPKYDIFPNQLRLNQYGCQPRRTPKWKQFQFCLLFTSLLIQSCFNKLLKPHLSSFRYNRSMPFEDSVVKPSNKNANQQALALA